MSKIGKMYSIKQHLAKLQALKSKMKFYQLPNWCQSYKICCYIWNLSQIQELLSLVYLSPTISSYFHWFISFNSVSGAARETSQTE